MRTIRTIGLSLLLASGIVTAQKTLPAVEVRAASDKTLVIACANPEQPRIEDVNRTLGVTNPAQGNKLRRQLMAAVAEACSAGKARIQVARTDSGSLTWKPLQ